MSHHGDKDNPTNAILNYTRLLNIKPDEVHSGHLHSFSIKDDCDSEVIVNGSVCGSDDYAVQIRRSTKPSQVLRIYDNDTCTYKITLD